MKFLRKEKMENKRSCCEVKEKKTAGFWSGLLFGLLPHSFCISFIILTVIGATALAGLAKNILLIPNFFQILILLSLILASISAFFYLKRNSFFSLAGIKKKWRYLFVLYGTTLGVNLLMVMVVFPWMANLNLVKQSNALSQKASTASVVLAVDIPCSGHAPLIIDEARKIQGVISVVFKYPNLFEINYNPLKISPTGILSLEIFKTFRAKINSGKEGGGESNFWDASQPD